MYSNLMNNILYYIEACVLLYTITYFYSGMIYKYVDHTDITDLLDINLARIKK